MDEVININGLNVAYTLSGIGADIVLLHGWMCNRKFWKEQILFLSGTHRVLAPDFRGHGESETSEGDYTIEQLTEDIFELMRELGIKRAVLVGHSMGGMVAQQFCISHRTCVSGLVLVTTIAADAKDRLISKRIRKDASRIGFRNAFLTHFEGWFDPATDSKIIRWVKEQMLRTSENVGLSLVQAYRRFDLRRHLSSFPIPTLVVGTGSDQSALPAESKELADLIREAQLVMIDGSGHFPMLETPQKLNKTLETFLFEQNLQ